MTFAPSNTGDLMAMAGAANVGDAAISSAYMNIEEPGEEDDEVIQQITCKRKMLKQARSC